MGFTELKSGVGRGVPHFEQSQGRIIQISSPNIELIGRQLLSHFYKEIRHKRVGSSQSPFISAALTVQVQKSWEATAIRVSACSPPYLCYLMAWGKTVLKS